MIRIVYTAQAEEELRVLWRYIADFNEPAADRIVMAISKKIEALREHPRLGPRRPDIREAARLLVQGNYVVLYETHPDTDEGPVDWVEVVSIVDGRRDLGELF